MEVKLEMEGGRYVFALAKQARWVEENETSRVNLVDFTYVPYLVDSMIGRLSLVKVC